jgi:transposase InsO family protein
VVFHADRGCQYTSGAYATLADELPVILSSGRTGQCWDDALAESFFASLKGECLDQRLWLDGLLSLRVARVLSSLLASFAFHRGSQPRRCGIPTACRPRGACLPGALLT